MNGQTDRRKSLLYPPTHLCVGWKKIHTGYSNYCLLCELKCFLSQESYIIYIHNHIYCVSTLYFTIVSKRRSLIRHNNYCFGLWLLIPWPTFVFQISRLPECLSVVNIHRSCHVVGLFMVFSATFSNIILWRSVLLVEEAGEPRENHRPAMCVMLRPSVIKYNGWSIRA